MMIPAAPMGSSLERDTQAALADLFSLRAWGDAIFVDVPIFHPSGAAATVRVKEHSGRYVISDGGFAFREAEMLGAERMFRRIAEDQAGQIGGKSDGRTVYMFADSFGLSGAISDIATASAHISAIIAKKAGARGEAEIVDHLVERLVKVFGDFSVSPQVPLKGPSTKQWYADALVQVNDRKAIFQAVTKHHASVYSTSAMFHDLALGEMPVATVAVVRDKQEMGAFLGILAQAGHVIEECQPDAVYRAAVDLLGVS